MPLAARVRLVKERSYNHLMLLNILLSDTCGRNTILLLLIAKINHKGICMNSRKKSDIFTRFTSRTSATLGRPWVFVAALVALVLWALSGPLLGFSDTWQLIINTSTTIVTFLMVFIIQNTQNRDNLALNIKQDAIMRKLGVTGKDLLEAEDQSDKKLEKEKKQMQHRGSAKKKK